MKFALISADPSHKVRFRIGCEEGDCTSFMNWVDVWRGFHLCYEKLREEDMDYLKHFDVVMMSGHPGYMTDIIRIARFLKESDTVSMFYPEGSWQLYDNSIRGFHREYYDAWNACDILSSAEEDKVGYYRSFIRSEAIVRFIHVPMRPEMERGEFFIPRAMKARRVLVYGDNNSNHPIVAVSCANKINAEVYAAEFGGVIGEVGEMFPSVRMIPMTKLGQYPFLRVLGSTIVHFYPTEWIGTNRQVVSCSVVGTPCIGSSLSHTQKRLFPDLACDTHDVDAMAEKAERLISDTEYYEKTVKSAFHESMFYWLDATKNRFLSAVEDARGVKAKMKSHYVAAGLSA